MTPPRAINRGKPHPHEPDPPRKQGNKKMYDPNASTDDYDYAISFRQAKTILADQGFAAVRPAETDNAIDAESGYKDGVFVTIPLNLKDILEFLEY